jgi:hypothetical protein
LIDWLIDLGILFFGKGGGGGVDGLWRREKGRKKLAGIELLE